MCGPPPTFDRAGTYRQGRTPGARRNLYPIQGPGPLRPDAACCRGRPPSLGRKPYRSGASSWPGNRPSLLDVDAGKVCRGGIAVNAISGETFDIDEDDARQFLDNGSQSKLLPNPSAAADGADRRSLRVSGRRPPVRQLNIVVPESHRPTTLRGSTDLVLATHRRVRAIDSQHRHPRPIGRAAPGSREQVGKIRIRARGASWSLPNRRAQALKGDLRAVADHPRPVVAEPPKPEGLGPVASEVWDQIVPELVRLKMVAGWTGRWWSCSAPASSGGGSTRAGPAMRR